ncbi:MAG TPA: hypothetical protein VN238_21995 [Solirubrobacteraceae bacterium]|nr:hypothetical protein [Solirubrobacteraceae bacterium]
MTRPRSTRAELEEATAHGDLYLRRLRRAQLSLSLLALVVLAGLVGALPLLLLLVPSLGDVDVLGVPLAIGLVIVPPLVTYVALGWLYQRRADALDEAFRDLVGDE